MSLPDAQLSRNNGEQMTTVVARHIEIGSDGVPRITGTQTKVFEVVLDRLAHHSGRR